MQGWRIALWVAIVLVILMFLYYVRGILLPFVVAFAISAMLEPTIKRLRLRGWPRPLAIWSIFLVFIGVLTGMALWLTPIISNQVGGFKNKIDELTANITHQDESQSFFVRWNPAVQIAHPDDNAIDKAFSQNESTLERFGLPTTRRAFLAQYVEPQRAQLGKSIQKFLEGFLGIASGLVSHVLTLMFVPLLVLLVLFNLDQMKRRSVTWIPPAIRANTISVIAEIGQVFSSYLRGVTIAVLGYMLTMSVVLYILGAPYSILLGVIFGALYLVPYLNVLISGTILVVVTGLSNQSSGLLFHSSSPWGFAILLLLAYMVCHFTYDSLVYPRVVGKAVGLDPIVSMFVIFSGGALFGLVGMIIAFPLAGSVKVILDRLIRITSGSQDALRLPSVPLRHRTTTVG
jgi:predicted PurR-regulated permease PerM